MTVLTMAQVRLLRRCEISGMVFAVKLIIQGLSISRRVCGASVCSRAGSIVLSIVILHFTGCATRYYETRDAREPIDGTPYLIRPVIAVTDFENKSGFSGSWNLGSGMAEVLITQLIDTDRAIVLERKHINDVISEINLQNSEMFRKENSAARGRLKTARYLIRGSITDFTVTRDTSGWFSSSSKNRFFARWQKARVTLHAMLVDVENGEVIGSVKKTGDASSGLFGGTVDYKNVTFGGDTFFRTPLGHATEEAMKKVVAGILNVIPPEYWRPIVADTDNGRAIINGGANVDMQPGSVFKALGPERIVTDPLTGEIIERRKGAVKGLVRITDVLANSSHGDIIKGTVSRGDWLEPVARE